MNLKITLTLGFENVYPEEEPKEIIEYLDSVPKDKLLKIIGLFNTFPRHNYDTIYSNPEIQADIINRVENYRRKNNIIDKPELVSRETHLKFAEVILSNKDKLLENNDSLDTYSKELNLFKALLIINQKNKKGEPLISEDLEITEKIAQMMVAISFPTSDLGRADDITDELSKLVYCTIERFEMLIEFLNSKPDYEYLVKALYLHFNVESIDKLRKYVKSLFYNLLRLKINNLYAFSVTDEKDKLFLSSLVSNDIGIDYDFTNLRKYPIYKLNDETYSIIDYFLTVDKFYKGVKFILKESFNEKDGLPDKDGRFFNFFNKQFSENFLMKTVLDKVFHKSYFIKKNVKNIKRDKTHEPDYYVRHNNCILFFENKDVLIRKEVKSSGDIKKILKVFEEKFLKNNDGKPVGIGQLVNSISQIVENNFNYDDYVNTKPNLIIYPILLIHDRILEIPGVNYILNKWYLESVKDKLGEKYNPNFIKSLTVIDIDTIIFGLDHFTKNDNNFKDFIEGHLKEMNTVNGYSFSWSQLDPISYRLFHKKELFSSLSEENFRK
jgi:hypothetical protein